MDYEEIEKEINDMFKDDYITIEEAIANDISKLDDNKKVYLIDYLKKYKVNQKDYFSIIDKIYNELDRLNVDLVNPSPGSFKGLPWNIDLIKRSKSNE